MVTRRTLLEAGGLALAGLAAAPALRAAAGRVVEIRMSGDPLGARVWFDPVGVRVEPGTTVRWVVERHVHTTTAYHPASGRKPRRIPEGAVPWNSGYLVNPGDRFEVTLTVPGVYDYFCQPHEAAGMVGRIVVGRPAKPAYDDAALPPAARAAFPTVDEIVSKGAVRRG